MYTITCTDHPMYFNILQDVEIILCVSWNNGNVYNKVNALDHCQSRILFSSNTIQISLMRISHFFKLVGMGIGW